jgi:two-component system, cell cycle sensor histidine kinase and response regulator CckA
MPPSHPSEPLQAISDLARLLSRNPSLASVAGEAARLAVQATRAAAALVLERRPEAGTFTVRGSYGWAAPPAPDALAAGADHLSEALRGAEGVIIGDLAARPGEPAILAERGLTEAAAVAIGDGDQPVGVLAVYSEAPAAFSNEQTLPLLAALSALLAAGVRQARLSTALESEKDERLRLASLVEGSDHAIVSSTPEGTILSWNPGAERLYGYRAPEILGRDVSVLVPPDRQEDRYLVLGRVRAGERIPAFDAVHHRKDGSPVTVSLSLSPVTDAQGKVVAVAGIAHDVTETRRLESELRQSAKMEALGRLAGGLAHDFNNMLTVIDGYSQLLLLKLPADSPHRELIEEIHKAGARAADLTRQLMAFSRKSLVHPEVLDVSEVVESNADMLRRVIGEDVTITTRLEPNLQHVMADRPQLDQALVNIALNARDAMPNGGRLIIETSNVQFDGAHGVPPREPPGRYVLLAISDTGVGMDAATRNRIFEPFFTTKGGGRGTGLGLAMLQNFVRQSGGFISLYSEPEHGTTFKIYLPTVDLPVMPRQAAGHGQSPSGNETILVVEDDAAVRQFTEAVLRAAGYEVLSAGQGDEALALARRDPRPIHLLMTDVVMPGVGGHALAEQFRSVKPQGRVLFTSGYTPEAVGRRGIAIPAAQFIQKPYSPAALCRQVRAILDRE